MERVQRKLSPYNTIAVHGQHSEQDKMKKIPRHLFEQVTCKQRAIFSSSHRTMRETRWKCLKLYNMC